MKQSPHILVVEDDAHVRQLIYLVLHQAGYRVDLAEDGQAGWEALRGNHYDLVMTDNSMPRLKGVQLIQKMRTAGMGVPVIFATGFLSPDDEVEFQGIEVDGRLVKPFGNDELLGMVHSVLTKSAQPHIISDMWHAA